MESADPGAASYISTAREPGICITHNQGTWLLPVFLTSTQAPGLGAFPWTQPHRNPGLSLTVSQTSVVPRNTKDKEHKRQMTQMKLLQDILLQKAKVWETCLLVSVTSVSVMSFLGTWTQLKGS